MEEIEPAEVDWVPLPLLQWSEREFFTINANTNNANYKKVMNAVSLPVSVNHHTIQEEEGRYALCFPSISTQAFKFDVEKAAAIACQVIKEFLDQHKDERIRLYLVDLTESVTLAKFRQAAASAELLKDKRFIITPANLINLRANLIPCWYIVNASNAAFNSGGSGTNKAIHKACKGGGTSLKKLTLQTYKPPAIIGKAYPVDLVSGSVLRDIQGVRTVIHVVGPNMDPKRKNCLGGNYAIGSQLLRKAYESILMAFYERTGLGTMGKIPLNVGDTYDTIPLPHWCFLDTDSRWEAYPEAVADEIEFLWNFSVKSGKKLVLAPQILKIIDWDKMEFKSMRKYANASKSIIRALWFWQDENGNWIPYPSEVASKLEKIIKEEKHLNNRVEVTKEPSRFVLQTVDGNFRQYRVGKKGNLEGRAVRRGYQGRIIPIKELKSYQRVDDADPNISELYEKGCNHFLTANWYNVSTEYRKAYEFFSQAALSNHTNAILMISLYYIFGFDTVLPDDEEAISWLTKASRNIIQSDEIQARAAAVEWFNLIIDENHESKEEQFFNITKKWGHIDPKSVIIY
jgi:O-acetyl-ADP-ribose deacetylase (regulator of RNase III)